MEDARAWVDCGISQQSASSLNGYVKVENCHYHVITTPCGPLVSLLEWRVDKDEHPGLAPVHNVFAVTGEARDQAVHAWNQRFKARSQALPVNTGETGLHALLKPARSGGR